MTGAGSESFFLTAADRREFRGRLEAELASWCCDGEEDAPWWAAAAQLPRYFDALLGLFDDPELDPDRRRLVRRVIKYLMSPIDLLPELVHGAKGYCEDLYLLAAALEHWSQDWGWHVLERHGFHGSDDVLALRDTLEGCLDQDVCRHLASLLEPDAVAGDELHTGPVEAERPLGGAPRHTIVYAGPGTGKTYRIETELERLLSEERVAPEQIVVTTFTNKAADELRVRIRARLLAHPAIADVDGVLQRLSVSTIHSFCHSLIAQFHHHSLFIKGTFSPIDDTQRTLFLFRHGIGALRLRPVYERWRVEQRPAAPGKHAYRPTDLFHFYGHVSQVYDFISEEMLSGAGPTLRRSYVEILRGRGDGVEHAIVRTYPSYWKALQSEGFLDHSMLLAYVEALLVDPQIAACVRRRFRYLLVDEYQDTNPIQDRIFGKIAGGTGSLFAVADDDQSIYAFRGADVRNALSFDERYRPVRAEQLTEHRRSTAALLAASQQLIGHNRKRRDKALSTHNEPGELPWRVEASAEELPHRIAEVVSELHRQRLIDSWSEVAVLFRMMAGRAGDFEAAFSALGVPCATVGDRHFLAKPVVHAFIKMLGMLHDGPQQITARKRAHRAYFEAVGWTDRPAMVTAMQEWSRTLHDGRYESLLDLYYRVLADTGAISVPELLPDLGRLSALIAEAETELRSPDLVKRLGYFLQYAEAARNGIEGPAAPPRDAVQMMTIHKAKGLELPVVVIADATADHMPAQFGHDMLAWLRREMAGQEPWLDPLEEERRILYVALTRAQRLAVIGTTPDAPSPFLAELPTQAAPDRISPPSQPPRPRSRASGQPPLHASHGHLYDYRVCPKRYLLEDRYGFAGRSIQPLRAGTSLHRALEILHRLVRAGEPTPPERRRRIFERCWVMPAATRKAANELEDNFALFERYAAQLDAAANLRILDMERPFYVAEGDGVLTGKIDLLRERDGALEIVEFKYNDNPLIQDYARMQLDHYSLAFPGEQPRLFVHYLKNDSCREIQPRTPEAVRAEIAAAFASIRRSVFPPSPQQSKCKICPVRFACAEAGGASRAPRGVSAAAGT